MTLVKAKSTKETDALIKDLVENYLMGHTIQFFYKTNEGLRPFGSGVFARIHDTYFILTASHVADFLVDNENQLFVRVGKEKFVNIIGEIKYTDTSKGNGIDLAYIKIDQQVIPAISASKTAVTIDKISKHNKTLDASNYCIIGFPEKNIKFNSGVMETGASFYLTHASSENRYHYYKCSKETHFIVEMRGKGIDFANGQQTKINTEFYGISGCGLWYIILNKDSDTEKFSIDYRLIAIMTEFKKGKYFCLIGNKIHLIIDALKMFEGFNFRER